MHLYLKDGDTFCGTEAVLSIKAPLQWLTYTIVSFLVTDMRHNIEKGQTMRSFHSAFL